MASVYLTLAIVFNALANGFFKFATNIPDLTFRKGVYLGIGLLIGLANTVCYIKALEKIDLGTVYPVFSAGTIILIALISALFFKEVLSLQKAAGLVVICIGLVLMWRA